MGESQYPDPGSGIRDEQLCSYFLELRNHFFAFFDEDPGSGMEKSRIRDPAGINIPDPQHWIKNSSAFLRKYIFQEV